MDLLAAIRAAPDDDAPRLVYADWLLERGDKRGELIIAQCTRSRLEAAGDYTSAEYRNALVMESVAMRDVREPWLAELGLEDMANVAFRRGLPIALGGTPAQLLERWSAVSAYPLEILILVQAGNLVTAGDLRRLAASAPIPTLQTLSIATRVATAQLDAARLYDELSYIDEHDAMVVFPDDELAPMGRFHDYTTALGHGSGSDGGSVTVFENTEAALPRSLRALSVCCDRVSYEALCRNIWFNAVELENLQLGAVDTWNAAYLFADEPKLRKLSFEAEAGVFRPEVGRRFAMSGAAKTLSELDAAFPLDGLVASALEHPRLERLSLTGGGDAAALEHVLRHQPKLHQLTIGRFDGDVIGALERAAPPQLSILMLREMKQLDVARLGRWEQRLASLTLHDCGDAGWLLNRPALAEIPWLHLGGQNNRFPDAYRYSGDTWP